MQTRALTGIIGGAALSRSITHIRYRRLATFSMACNDASSAHHTISGPLERSIREKLAALLHPTELSITNDSWQHRHHAAMRAQDAANGETHFSVQIVSDAFKGKNTMQRHRMIYSALAEELSQGLHALSLKTKTPEEMQKTEI